MLRVIVECRDVGGEKVAKRLDKLTDGFRVWVHENKVYALFDVNSFQELKEVVRKLKRIRRIELRFVKIATVANHG